MRGTVAALMAMLGSATSEQAAALLGRDIHHGLPSTIPRPENYFKSSGHTPSVVNISQECARRLRQAAKLAAKRSSK